MLKKINISELRTGMYIDKLEGSWLESPFWKSAFSLTDKKDLLTLQGSGIKHIWIDTSKGDDVEVSAIEVLEPAEPATKEKEVVENTEAIVEHVSIEEEIEHARETLSQAKAATVSMFQEARMGNSVKIAEAAPLVDEIAKSVARNPGAMLSLTRLKNQDDYTYLHSVAVCALMIALGKQLDYQGDLQSLGMAGLLHDIGKMSIPEDVLNKPGKLTDEEFSVVKSHPVRGWEMLKESFGVDEIALDVCLHHHERVDGRGYPDKVSGDDLSLVARMSAVCDVYDAITSDRCYKKGWEPAAALKKMAQWKDGHFDEEIFHAFVKTIGIYPTGTLVKLQSGRLGVVLDQSEESLLTPKIKVFFSCSTRAFIAENIIDLAHSGEVIESIEEPETWGLNDSTVMDII